MKSNVILPPCGVLHLWILSVLWTETWAVRIASSAQVFDPTLCFNMAITLLWRIAHWKWKPIMKVMFKVFDNLKYSCNKHVSFYVHGAVSLPAMILKQNKEGSHAHLNYQTKTAVWVIWRVPGIWKEIGHCFGNRDRSNEGGNTGSQGMTQCLGEKEAHKRVKW
jgi:hypothetical protein